jgi:serine/threonine protein kinase
VSEREENLSQVLPGRALTPDEARAMLESVLDALAYIHRKGFVHGHIKPANIMASGDQLKVSSDGLRNSGESPDGLGHQSAYDAPEYVSGILPMSQKMSPAGDVWSVGMTLVETLTQNPPVARTANNKIHCCRGLCRTLFLILPDTACFVTLRAGGLLLKSEPG